MSDNRTVSDFLAFLGAAAMGAVIGAGAALMLAPKAGAELRSELRDTAQQTSASVQKITEQFIEQVKATADEVKQQTSEVGQPTAEDVAETASEEAEDVSGA